MSRLEDQVVEYTLSDLVHDHSDDRTLADDNALDPCLSQVNQQSQHHSVANAHTVDQDRIITVIL